MSKKLLLKVLLPAAQVTSEFWVPKELTVYETTRLVARLFEQTEGAYFADSKQVALYSLETNNELDSSAFLGACGLRNGDELMLV